MTSTDSTGLVSLSLKETWQDDSFLDSELYLPGIAVYIAGHLNPKRVDISVDDIKALWFVTTTEK